jgi:hypothetical protein
MEQCRPRPPSHRRPYPLREHDEKAKSTLLPSPSPSRMPLLCPYLAPRPRCHNGPPHRASTQEAPPFVHITVELEPSQAPLLCFAPSFPAPLAWPSVGAAAVFSTRASASSPKRDSSSGPVGPHWEDIRSPEAARRQASPPSRLLTGGSLLLRPSGLDGHQLHHRPTVLPIPTAGFLIQRTGLPLATLLRPSAAAVEGPYWHMRSYV